MRQKATLGASELLISSLGETSPDAFYFRCAYSSLNEIEHHLGRETSQDHLNLGLKAAVVTHRVDVARLLLDRGADIAPLIAAIGLDAAQELIANGDTALQHQQVETRPLDLPTSSTSSDSTRAQNDLRLRWVSLQPKSTTLRAVVEGVDPPQPTATHLQALYTSLSAEQRIAWIQFDLDQPGGAAHLDRIADVRNVQGAPLHWAVDDHADVWENREVLAFLLARGADPFVKNHVGLTPRLMCLELWARGEESLPEKTCDFYCHAVGVLATAERMHEARATGSAGFFSTVKSVFGLSS